MELRFHRPLSLATYDGDTRDPEGPLHTRFAIPVLLTLLTAPMAAQDSAAHQHSEGMKHEGTAALPGARSAGQSAFAALSETVRLLTADPTTDWSKVNIEALRQHLIDMDNVTLRSVVNATAAKDGLTMDVTGAGVVSEAIRRMVTSHAHELDEMPDYRATVSTIANGARLTVTARTPGDSATMLRIRGLGFAGLMTEGDHHATHHLMIARGESVHVH